MKCRSPCSQENTRQHSSLQLIFAHLKRLTEDMKSSTKGNQTIYCSKPVSHYKMSLCLGLRLWTLMDCRVSRKASLPSAQNSASPLSCSCSRPRLSSKNINNLPFTICTATQGSQPKLPGHPKDISSLLHLMFCIRHHFFNNNKSLQLVPPS